MVTLNKFSTDTEAELLYVEKFCKNLGCEFALAEVWEKGGEGGIDLANKIISTLETKKSNFTPLYNDNLEIKEKIEVIAKQIYGAKSVTYDKNVLNEIEKLEDFGYGNLPICIAKTQYSLSDDPKKLGRPADFD